jgi:uncharacterized delta-60 repeat protein
MFKKINFWAFSILLTSTAYATPTVTFNPPLAVNTVEHFMVTDGGTDVTSNYTIQSIAADPVSGYTPARSSTAFRANQTGSFSITFVSNIDSSTFTSPASYTAAPAYIQLVSGAGQSSAAGSPLAQPIKVFISDSNGNPISGVTVTWSITASGGTFSSPSTSDSTGNASTILTMGSTPGTYSVTATAGSLSTSDLIQETANPTSNQLSNLTFQAQPSPLAQQNIIFPSQPVLSLTNGSGAAYNISTPVSVTAFKNSSCTNPASGNLGGTTTVNSSSGTATFTNLTYSVTEAIFLKFTAGSLSSCSDQVSVSQPATSATKLSLNFTPTSAYVQMQFNLLVNVTDNAGNIIVASNSPISLAAYTDASCSTAATGTLSSSTGISAYQGQALFNSLAYSAPETIYIKASSTGLTPICSSGIQIKGNPLLTPTALAFYSAPTSEFAGKLFGVQPFTFIKNGVGSIYQGSTSIPITMAAYSDASCSTAATGTLSGGTVNNSVFGVGSFTNLGYSSVGTIYLGISSPGLTSACSAALTITGTALSSASQLKFVTPPPSSAVLNTFLTTQPAVEVDDSAGAIVSGAQGYVSLNWFSDSTCTTTVSGAAQADGRIVNGKAQFNYIGSTAVGVYYLSASYNNIAPICSSGITVTSSACSASEHINSTTYSCDVNSKDCSASIANSSIATSTWNGSAYGACTVSTCSNGFNNEGNACLAAVAITPLAGSVVASKTIQLAATGGDSTYTWSADKGSVSSTGLFTAPATVGTAIVTVKDSHNISASSTITVLQALTMTPKTATVIKNTNLQMVVSGGASPYNFTSTGGIVNSSGLFGAGSIVGPASVTVTDASGSSVTSNLTISLADGSLDPSFNTTGQALVDLGTITGANYQYMQPSSADVGSDGSVYVGTGYNSNAYILKYTSSGVIDTTFGSNGSLAMSGFNSPKIKALSSGGFIAIMNLSASPYTTTVRKYSSSGSLVGTFGSSGSTTFNYASGTNSTNVNKINSDSSDNIYLAASDYTGSYTEARVIKINSSGAILYSRVLNVSSNPSVDSGSMAIDFTSSGKAVINLNVYTSPRTNYVYLLDSSTGANDPAFNSGSPVSVSGTAPTTYTTFGVRTTIDGSFLVFGQKDNTSPYIGIVQKIGSTGALDTSFGTNGVLTGTFGASPVASSGVQLMNTIGNKMLTTAGSGGMGSINNALILRTSMDGTVDSSFNGGSAINQSTYSSFSLNYIDTYVGVDGKITGVAYYYDSGASKYKTLISRYTSSLTAGPIPVLATSTFTWGQSQTLSGVGGTGPYTYSVVSGPGTIDSNGVFTAGSSSGQVTIQITDSTGATGTAKVNVIKFSIAASATKRYPGQSATVSIATGTGTAPYTYTLTTNNSGGSITSGGLYTAGSIFGGSDTIQLTDASGNSNTTSISVMKAITISPTTVATGTSQKTNFSASGGSTSGYTYSLTTSAGIGSSVFSSQYTAGTNTSATPAVEQVTVTDSEGNTASASISVSRLSGATLSTSPLNNFYNYSSATYSCLTNGGYEIFATPVLIQSTKKVVVITGGTGTCSSSIKRVYRVNTNGTSDNTFGATYDSFNSQYYTDVGAAVGNYSIFTSMVDGSDRIYVIAASGPTFKILRLTANGALDTSFGPGGVLVYSTAANITGCLTGKMQTATSGKIMAMMQCYSGGYYALAAMRFNANGTMDSAYGSGGMTSFIGVTQQDYISGPNANSTQEPNPNIAGLLSDDSFVYSGTKKVGSTIYTSIYHITSSGAMDSTFNAGNGTALNSTLYSSVNSLSVINNKIYVARNYNTYTEELDSFNADGTVNTSFGVNGVATASQISNGAWGSMIATDSSGKIYIGDSQGGMYRYSSSGVFDTTFGVTSVGYSSVSSSGGSLRGLITLADGSLMTISGGLNSGTALFIDIRNLSNYP